MATNKHASIRYRALDECFRDTKRKYFFDDLKDACERALADYKEEVTLLVLPIGDCVKAKDC